MARSAVVLCLAVLALALFADSAMAGKGKRFPVKIDVSATGKSVSMFGKTIFTVSKAAPAAKPTKPEMGSSSVDPKPETYSSSTPASATKPEVYSSSVDPKPEKKGDDVKAAIVKVGEAKVATVKAVIATVTEAKTAAVKAVTTAVEGKGKVVSMGKGRKLLKGITISISKGSVEITKPEITKPSKPEMGSSSVDAKPETYSSSTPASATKPAVYSSAVDPKPEKKGDDVKAAIVKVGEAKVAAGKAVVDGVTAAIKAVKTAVEVKEKKTIMIPTIMMGKKGL